MRLISLLFMTLFFCVQTEAYQSSLQKYDLENGKNYCFELYEKVFRVAYTKPINALTNSNSVCLNGQGQELLNELHQIERRNRLTFNSQEISTALLSKASLVISAHLDLLSRMNLSSTKCSKAPSAECLVYPYRFKRDAQLLLNDYDSVIEEIFKISMSCNRSEFGKVGCFQIHIKDPYLEPLQASTIILPGNMLNLKYAYDFLIRGKQTLERSLL